MEKNELASKGLEALVDLRNNWWATTDQKERAYDIIEKELKALEIIKNKDVCVELLRYWWKCEYNDKDILEKYNYMHHWKQLTQEEYDLLKEVLL